MKEGLALLIGEAIVVVFTIEIWLVISIAKMLVK